MIRRQEIEVPAATDNLFHPLQKGLYHKIQCYIVAAHWRGLLEEAGPLRTSREFDSRSLLPCFLNRERV